MSKRAHTDFSDRFFAKVGEPNEVGCREWQASRHRLGYGNFRLNGKIEGAHRVAFLLAHGRWPNGDALHSCDNRACCEAAHLSEGSHAQNMSECAERGRNRTPRPGNGVRKLSEAAIGAIRHRFSQGERNKTALAREYGVSAPRIRQVLHG